MESIKRRTEPQVKNEDKSIIDQRETVSGSSFASYRKLFTIGTENTNLVFLLLIPFSDGRGVNIQSTDIESLLSNMRRKSFFILYLQLRMFCVTQSTCNINTMSRKGDLEWFLFVRCTVQSFCYSISRCPISSSQIPSHVTVYLDDCYRISRQQFDFVWVDYLTNYSILPRRTRVVTHAVLPYLQSSFIDLRSSNTNLVFKIRNNRPIET